MQTRAESKNTFEPTTSREKTKEPAVATDLTTSIKKKTAVTIELSTSQDLTAKTEHTTLAPRT